VSDPILSIKGVWPYFVDPILWPIKGVWPYFV